MPNNITNILIVSGHADRCVELFDAIKTDQYGRGSIDFAKIIPVPDNIYQGSLGKEEVAKYGKNNWLDWNTTNWGSKWNSYGYDEFTERDFDGVNLQFQTAWSDVHQVIERLAALYPDLEFSYYWADEDFGTNVGRREYAGGEETECYIPNSGSREALELAADIHQVELEDEGYLWNESANEYEHHPDAMGWIWFEKEAVMIPVDAAKENYELAEIDQRVVLFTNMRIDRNTVPEGLYCYDVRDSDNLDGSMAEVKPHVLVNHWGTILSHEPFPLNEWGGYYPEDWSYLGSTMTLSEFSEATKEQLTACLQSEPPSAAMTMQ